MSDEMKTGDERSGNAPASSPAGNEPSGRSGQPPQPPNRYDPDMCPPSLGPGDSQERRSEADPIRRMTSAAQIMAIVSLFVGGIVLSSAAVVVAIMAYRKASKLGMATGEADGPALKRTAAIAIAMGVLALTVNAVSFMMIYPMVLEMLRSGDYTSLWNGADTPASSGSSFWG